MMNTATVLIDWAFRSSILILSGALLLRALRVKDPSIRLAGWTAMLAGSLLIPALAAALPELPFDINALVRRAIPAHSIEAPAMADQATHSPLPAVPIQSGGVVSGGYNAADRDAVSSSRFDRWSNRWMDVVAIVYVVIAGTLLAATLHGLDNKPAIVARKPGDWPNNRGNRDSGIESRPRTGDSGDCAFCDRAPSRLAPVGWREGGSRTCA